jgi:co-chaperonin GroES (HSP10)
MTAKEQLIERIKSLPLDPEYKENHSIPIPLGKGVLVKKIESSVITKTTAGILLAKGDNTPEPHMGIIQSVGPLCSEYLRVGLRCFYNHFVDSSFYIGGVHYAKMDENDVYYLIPPDTALFESPKSASQVRREKKQGDSDSYLERRYNHDQEEKNKKEIEKKSGKTIIIKQ